MNCPCGGKTAPTTMTAKTWEAAAEWWPAILDDELPARIVRDVCEGCGRQRVRVYTLAAGPDPVLILKYVRG